MRKLNKLVRGEPPGPRLVKGARLQRGTPVVMTDGWRGRVETDNGDTIVAIREGEVPNDWLRGYRAFGRRELTVKGGTALYDWSAMERGATVIDLQRERHARLEREREWNDAPY
jgi:hypothetical protein